MAKKTIRDYLGQGFTFQLCPRSAKVFDTAGKMVGIVTDVERFDYTQRVCPRRLFEGVDIIRKKGLPSGVDTVRDYLFNGKEVYAFKDGKILTLDGYREYLDGGALCE